jgi:ubiquinone/menaquinone biosynthesis C-methylase UbiE
MLGRGKASRIVSIDLSDAISVAYQKMEENPNWLGVQADLSSLPFDNAVFSIVYCEGVIQHTADSNGTVKQLMRLLQPQGLLIATHYGLPSSLAGRTTHRIREFLRWRLSKVDKHTLLFLSGCIAAVAHVPLIGRLWGRTIAITNPKMRNFKATWSCTYDSYGYHSYQRHISAAEFTSYLLNGDVKMEIIRQNGCEILARRVM